MEKIAILAFGDKHGGGVYQYTQSIIDALKKDKTKQYIIFCNSNDNRFDSYGLVVRKIDKLKSNVAKKIIRFIQHLFYYQAPLLFTRNEKDAFSDIDLFLSPLISAYPHYYMKKPFVFTLHDMLECYHPEYFSIYERTIRWVNNRALSKVAKKIICESIYVKNDIANYLGVDREKIHIIQSPPPEEFLNCSICDEQYEIINRKYNLPQKYIFYPAQSWFHKNHINLIEAFSIVSKKYDDVFLILSGSQRNNYKNLMEKIDELKLNTKVKHLGYVDYEDLPYVYKRSQFLVMPTLFESVSIPIYEAFALEVAVCSSDILALPSQVGDAGVLFNPNNIYDMAEKMLLYLDDEELRKEKARMGFERVRSFNHNEYRKNLLAVLNATDK